MKIIKQKHLDGEHRVMLANDLNLETNLVKIIEAVIIINNETEYIEYSVRYGDEFSDLSISYYGMELKRAMEAYNSL